MTNTKIIAQSAVCEWKPSRRSASVALETAWSNTSTHLIAGMLVLLLGVAYLYFINRSAIMGFEYRKAEKAVAELRGEQEQLRIREAELRSLYRIEEAGKRLQMTEYNALSYIEDHEVVALR